MPSDTTIYVAKYGDYLVKIAKEHGTTWQQIWNHPLNAEHRAKRSSPDELYPGDVLHVPITPGMVEPPPPEPPPPGPPAPPPPAPPSLPWPYPTSPPPSTTPVPSWACPHDICSCEQPHAPPPQTHKHTVFLYDDQSRRMPGARCRVTAMGIVLPNATQADGAGAITLDVQPSWRSLLIEWAPADTPLVPTLPYRRIYHLDLGDDPEQQVRRRLEHIGVSREPSLEEQIVEFQSAYGLPVDGALESVLVPLASYHDTAMLPPVPETPPALPVTPLPPDVRGPSQGSVSAVADRNGACHFSFRLVDENGQPVANEPFVLAVGDGRLLEALTGTDGTLEYGDVEAGDYLLRIRNLAMHVPAIEKTEHLRPLRVQADS